MPAHSPHHSPMLPAPPMPPRPARSHSFCCTPLPSQPQPRWSRRKQTSFAFSRSPAPRKADVSRPSGLERAHCNSVFETCNIVQRQGFSSIATLSSASGGGLGATRLRPAPVRKLHHRLTSWVNTDALQRLQSHRLLRGKHFHGAIAGSTGQSGPSRRALFA